MRSSGAAWQTVVVGVQTEPERLATVDLRRYIAQVTGAAPTVMRDREWVRAPRPAVLLGTPRTSLAVAAADVPSARLGAQGVWLGSVRLKGASCLVALGRTPQGALHAIYALLREAGFGFYLGSEAVPRSLPRRLTRPVLREPVFAIRGVLPWYNFLNSPTTWDPIDHRAFVDQLVRMGANFVGFHAYDNEPFAAVAEGAAMRWGERLRDTSAAVWGTAPMRTTEFAAGTALLYADETFGAETARRRVPDATAIREEQRVMREALDYARRRGLHTCLGFEMTGDPTSAADRSIFVRRLERLLDAYPALDYIWIWQPETVGVTGWRLPQGGPEASTAARYALARRREFRRAVERTQGERPFFLDDAQGRANRAAEGARLEQFSRIACRVLSRRTRPPRLVVCGWGGDERLLSAEYYEGLDRLLPRDVVFASLDHIVPRDRVDRVYRELSPQRERWPIPWLENDGDQWHPQPWVHTYEKLARDARSGGCQGLLAIHWRTRDVEESFAYLMEYAWEPDLTAHTFFRRLAAKCYSAQIAERMASIHEQLDRLGYRWIGGWGQSECAPFGWSAHDEDKAQQLRRLRAQVHALLPRSGPSAPRLRWLLGVMDWVLAFRLAQTDAMAAQTLLGRARAAQQPEATGLALQALDLLLRPSLANALRAFAGRITTRGELGVLATINAKAVVAWRDMVRQACEIAGAGAPAPADTPWSPAPQVIVPRHIASAEAGKSLTLDAVALGGSHAWVRWRPVGGARWTTLRMAPVRGWVRRATVPASAMRPPGIEVQIALAPEAPAAWGPVGITIFPEGPPAPPRKPRPTPVPSSLALTATHSAKMPVELHWGDVPAADFYRVYRDGNALVDTCVPYAPDAPRGAAIYVVEARTDAGAVVLRSSPVTVTAPALAPAPIGSLRARARSGGVLLRWDPVVDLLTSRFTVERRPHDDEGAWSLVRTVLADAAAGHVVRDEPPEGELTYRVTPVGPGGEAGPPAKASVRLQPEREAAAVVTEALTTAPSGAEMVGRVTFGADGARFGDGHLSLPHRPEFDMDDGLTVQFEFRADSVDGMPVLLCHGAWQSDGWFAQILGGRFLLRTPAGDAVGPIIERGRWYAIRWVFDGEEQRLWVDGSEVPQSQPLLRAVSVARRLVLGQYEAASPMYAFRGMLRNLLIARGGAGQNAAAPVNR